MLVNAILINQAFAQPYPILELALYDTQGAVVAAQRFEPREYVDRVLDADGLIPPGSCSMWSWNWPAGSGLRPTSSSDFCSLSKHLALAGKAPENKACTRLLNAAGKGYTQSYTQAEGATKMAALKRLILIFLVLWLPIKSVPAFVMPSCNQDMGMASHHVQRLADADQGQVPQSKNDRRESDQPSKHCQSLALCHLVSSSVILSVAIVIAPDSDKAFLPYRTRSLNGIVPDGLERPPRPPLA